MPPSADIWFLVVSNSTDGMGSCSVVWMYSAVNLRKKLYVTPCGFAEFLEIDRDIMVCFDAALDDGDPNLVSAVLDDIVRARNDAAYVGGGHRQKRLCKSFSQGRSAVCHNARRTRRLATE